jgi:hypothetical protein
MRQGDSAEGLDAPYGHAMFTEQPLLRIVDGRERAFEAAFRTVQVVCPGTGAPIPSAR